MIAMPLLQVLEKHNDKDAFCIYNDPLLQLFVSVLFLAGIVGAFIGSFTARRFGRKPTMILGGGFFLAGAVLLAPAVHVAMLILGRFCMGIGKRKNMKREYEHLPGRILILRSVWQKQFLLSCSSVHVTACCNLHFFTSWAGQVIDKGFDNCHLPHSSTAPNGSAPTAAKGPSHSSTKQQCAQYQTVTVSDVYMMVISTAYVLLQAQSNHFSLCSIQHVKRNLLNETFSNSNRMMSCKSCSVLHQQIDRVMYVVTATGKRRALLQVHHLSFNLHSTLVCVCVCVCVCE